MTATLRVTPADPRALVKAYGTLERAEARARWLVRADLGPATVQRKTPDGWVTLSTHAAAPRPARVAPQQLALVEQAS